MRVAVFGILLALFLRPLAQAEKIEDLKPQGYVNDYAGVLSSETQAQIAELCAEVEQKARAQIAVVTIRSLAGAPVEEFANKLYARWGVGYKGGNRGVLILLAPADHQYRVEVGYGLEPILPDGKVGGFGREMVPRLRQGDYNGTLLYLTAQIAGVIASDRGVTLGSLASEQSRTRPERGLARSGPGLTTIILLAIVALWGFGGLLPMIVGPRRGRFGGGWWGWGGPWIGTGGSWGGGSFGGFGGGGGFGGFGGGMSGGGGAGGSW